MKIIEDISTEGESELVVYSRDWTIATILSQIEQKNIDLNPKFQRRNAWNDARRSKLIESLVAGLPVPEIVLAEDPKKKKAFIVIDGKQRLLTIAGFVDPTVDYWKRARLKELKLRKDLNKKTYEQLKTEPALSDEYREFMNADVRCTIVSNFKTDDALYDIFYRLNTGSVPLSTQELRQVLHKGAFADFLVQLTNTPQPIHSVLGLNGPDTRLKDVEIVLRFIAIILFADRYKGNLKKFLDDAMKSVTVNWDKSKPQVEQVYEELNRAIGNLREVLGIGLVGRKFVDGTWESRFNRVLFEVEAFYFRMIPASKLGVGKKKFISGLQKLFEDAEFRSSVEVTTKTNDRYELRFSRFQELVNTSFGTAINMVPITADKS
ncbi:MAG TPA: DUF262 domain-containing protein [Pyrinomonadaceae bacterium]|nr:DUF262 domain-containing protein [Pyrinomonadaceae bacterium]